jgi:hypothetical protein
LEACGNHSALAACPNNFNLGYGDITRASYKIRILTPIIWSFATFCLLGIVGAKGREIWTRRVEQQARKTLSAVEKNDALSEGAVSDSQDGNHTDAANESTNDAKPRLITLNNLIYVLVTMCFLAGIGMQLSLLSIATSLDMMDRKDWSFGQVVAIKIWIPPLLAYLYREVEESNWGRKWGSWA